MPVDVVLRAEVPLGADQLVQLMTDTTNQEGFARHNGATLARCKVVEESNEILKLEIYAEEPAWHGRGTDKGTIYHKWDLPAQRCTWMRTDHTHGERVKVSGAIIISPISDAASMLEERITMDIRVPILGKTVAKRAAKKLEADTARRFSYWSR